MKNSKLNIGKQIKKYRVLRGMTQNDLAEKIGLTEKQISKIETGVHYPKFENFVKIMDILNIEMKDFDSGINVQNKNNILRNSILKIIYRADETELTHYAVLLKQLEKIFKQKKNKK